MLDKKASIRRCKPSERWIPLKKNHSGHYSVGMITAVLISLSAACPFASIQAASSSAPVQVSLSQGNGSSLSVPYEASPWVSPSDPTDHKQEQSEAASASPLPSPSPGGSSIGAPAQEQGVPADVKRASADTVRALSAQPPFARWKDAELSYHPLGPGIHSWLVQVNRAGEYIGYLIIGADHNGAYQLNEYGNGPGGPYSMNLLHQSLDSLMETELSSGGKLQVTRMYEEPLLAYWLVRSSTGGELCIDAFTGDPLPAEVASGNWKHKLQNNAIHSPIPSPTVSLQARPKAVTLSADRFDPYDDLGWLQSKQKLSIRSGTQFTSTLNASPRIVFSATGVNFAYGAPFAINGYQRWLPPHDLSHSVMYASTSRSGLSRFVPLDRLLSAGGFYRLDS
jgi:hypothetical protein